MSLPRHSLTILDVGHGNCAVIIDPDGTAIIDAGPGTALLEYLRERGVTNIHAILLSHTDADHIKGLIGLLASTDFKIHRIRVNSDALKTSVLWDDLLYELDKQQRRGTIEFHPTLTVSDANSFSFGRVQIEILAPSIYLAGKGPGGEYRDGRTISTNAVSAVIRISFDERRLALFTGDLDRLGLDDLLRCTIDPSAPILVFPHHGGRPGASDPVDFATTLSRLTSPTLVIFSIGRGGYDTPRPEIVMAVRALIREVRIACTQLSEHCAATAPPVAATHLSAVYSGGRHRNICCAGSIVFDMTDTTLMSPEYAAHQAYITRFAPTALCRRPLS